MKAKWAVVAAGLGFALVQAVPVMAHHSFAAEYDAKQPVVLKGTVTKFEWTNPHARFYVDVKDESGKVTNWNLELVMPQRAGPPGVDHAALNLGDTITKARWIQGQGRFEHGQCAGTVTLADGRKVGARSADDGGPTGPPAGK